MAVYHNRLSVAHWTRSAPPASANDVERALQPVRHHLDASIGLRLSIWAATGSDNQAKPVYYFMTLTLRLDNQQWRNEDRLTLHLLIAGMPMWNTDNCCS